MFNNRFDNVCRTPGMKIRSEGRGRGLAFGRGFGPIIGGGFNRGFGDPFDGTRRAGAGFRRGVRFSKRGL